MKLFAFASLLLLAACGLTPSEDRLFDPDKEFAKLDGPDVPTVQKSLERAAIMALSEGNNKRAAGLYDQLIDHDPEQTRYQFGMAEALRRLGEFKASVTLYERVLRTEASHLDAKEGLGLAKMALGDVEQSARILKEVLDRDNKRWRTLNALGILFAMKEMPKEAMAYLNEALKMQGNHAAVLNNIGLIQAAQHHYDDAISSFKEASRQAEEGPRREQIALNMALVYGISGDLQAAERVASEYLESGALQNNLGLYAYLADNAELAKSYLNMALSGTDVHYKRAWENLDIIANKDQSSRSSGTGKSIRVQ